MLGRYSSGRGGLTHSHLMEIPYSVDVHNPFNILNLNLLHYIIIVVNIG